MKLSERLQERLDKLDSDMTAFGLTPKNLALDHVYFIMSECLELAKSVESATAGELFVSRYDVRDFALADADGQLMVMSHLEGQRVALVPLPQQSET